MRLLRSSLLCLALGSAAISHGWSETGHMLIAAIAEQDLSPVASTEVSRLVASHRQRLGLPAMVTPSNGRPGPALWLAAPWADENRSPQSGPWHYINFHFRTDGKKTTNKPLEENVASAIERFEKVLADQSKPELERVDALLYLVHFVADAHQPLHAVARDTDQFPEGDRGGNEFAVQPHPSFSSMERPPRNLHSLWDFGAGLFMPEQKPFGEATFHRIGIQAKTLRAALPRRAYRSLNRKKPMEWAREGLDVAKKVVYRTEEGAVPKDEYLELARQASAQRATLAGYRLADLLNRVLKPGS